MTPRQPNFTALASQLQDAADNADASTSPGHVKRTIKRTPKAWPWVWRWRYWWRLFVVKGPNRWTYSQEEKSQVAAPMELRRLSAQPHSDHVAASFSASIAYWMALEYERRLNGKKAGAIAAWRVRNAPATEPPPRRGHPDTDRQLRLRLQFEAAQEVRNAFKNVHDRTKDECERYHFDALIFFKNSSTPPWGFRQNYGYLLKDWDAAPMNTFVVLTRRQLPAAVGGPVAYTQWQVDPSCFTEFDELVERIIDRMHIDPCPEIQEVEYCDLKQLLVRGAVFVSAAALLLLTIIVAANLVSPGSAASFRDRIIEAVAVMTGQANVRDLVMELEELQERERALTAELAVAREALSERDAESAESAAEAARQIAALERELAAVRAARDEAVRRRGLDEPPCILLPETAGRQPGYLLAVRLEQAGMTVTRHSDGRLADADLRAAPPPINDDLLARPLSLREFGTLAEPIFRHSRRSGCRYTVTIERGRHDSARAYQEQMDAVTQRFYIYERR